MNFLFISPQFPHTYRNFSDRLEQDARLRTDFHVTTGADTEASHFPHDYMDGLVYPNSPMRFPRDILVWADYRGFDVSHGRCWWQKQLPHFFGKASS